MEELNIISPSSSMDLPPSPPEQPLPLIVNQKLSEDYCEVSSNKFEILILLFVF